MEKTEKFITIPIEEYKELLEIAGRYKELKEVYIKEPATQKPIITWSGASDITKEPCKYGYYCES